MSEVTPKIRTGQQNKALHKFCSEMADVLNESGIPMSVFFKDIEADYTMESIKELWRSFARVKYGKDSTAEFTQQEVNAIYEEVNRHVAKFGLHLPFPSQQNTQSYLNSLELEPIT